MEPRILILHPKKLIGIRMAMSLAGNRTAELWRNFMPRRRDITNNLSNDLISLQIYGPTYFDRFNPAAEFEKWAAAEVSDFESVPAEMETLQLDGGMYAVFNYKGPSTDTSIFQYIFASWLPASGYALADRPHFEVLGDRYKNSDPASEEEIWIPVQPKGA